MTKQNEQKPVEIIEKTLDKSQFIKALSKFRKHCYGTYCPDCQYKGKNHSIITCFEKYMLEEVYE